MKKNLVKVKLLGCLGEAVGYSEWNLNVKSVGEALNAIEILSKRKLYKFLYDNDKNGTKYAIIINNKPLVYENQLNTVQDVKNSELCINNNNLKTIHIVPILQGEDSGLLQAFIIDTVTGVPVQGFANYPTFTAGVALIIAGIAVAIFGGPFAFFAVPLIGAGLGLVAAGVINILAKGPEEPEIAARSRTSFLFSGPVNISNEGGPVPLGYGELIIGSSIVSASYDIEHFNADDKTRTDI